MEIKLCKCTKSKITENTNKTPYYSYQQPREEEEAK